MVSGAIHYRAGDHTCGGEVYTMECCEDEDLGLFLSILVHCTGGELVVYCVFVALRYGASTGVHAEITLDGALR